jgi:hypothetical protein
MTRLDDVQALADVGGIVDHVDEADGEKYRSFVIPRWEDVRGLLAIARAAQELVRRDIPLEVVAQREMSLIAALADFEAGRNG